MSRAFVISALVAIVLASLAQGADEPLYGFSPASSKTQRDWEKRFRAIPSPQIMRDTMRHLSAHPHHVGSPYDKDNAEWILARFKSWGLDAHIEQYDVLFPTPKTRVVELTEPIRYVASSRSRRSRAIRLRTSSPSNFLLTTHTRLMAMSPRLWST
jgi:N-acetylated-alpha-linked acidic dipeptidase